MNTQALQQLYTNTTNMIDHVVCTFTEMRTLDAPRQEEEELEQSEEIRKRRRMLRTMRWALVLGLTYAGYKLVRYLASFKNPSVYNNNHHNTRRLLDSAFLATGGRKRTTITSSNHVAAAGAAAPQQGSL
mmetsp:Transcript_11593/g.17711  ORF Transcript_11593/g.17711 Transcript_11593/m.17711 type:complete len:130 (-) Transcript_11593:639-1028(-)